MKRLCLITGKVTVVKGHCYLDEENFNNLIYQVISRKLNKYKRFKRW